MSNDPEQEYFSDGLTEVLTGDLSKISSLFVIARNSAFTYKGKAIRLNPQHPPYYLWTLGRAYFLTRQYEEAIAAFKEAGSRARNPSHLLVSHLGLAVIYSETGREEEARAAAAEVLRIDPNFSLEMTKAASPYKDPVILERQLAALRKAGLK